MTYELMSVADDEAVLFEGSNLTVLTGLEPDTHYSANAVGFRTLPRPPGERLATIATVNDLHFGERECGRLEGMDVGPILSACCGSDPYPELMNRAAAGEIASLDPDAVFAKGDITATGDPAEYADFEKCYRPLLGDKLHVTRGNHDHLRGAAAFECPPAVEATLPGLRVAVLDTSRPGHGGGFISAGQFEWLDDVASESDRPVLVLGHHPCWEPDAIDWVGEGAAINPPDSARLVELVARRRAIVGYLAGHTHRNRVRRFAPSGDVPFVEVACVKDFPGTWAEYRVFESGVMQVHRRISDPRALAWSERCRALFVGLYPRYALGSIEDRCFVMARR